jgi:hypothetical protein
MQNFRAASRDAPAFRSSWLRGGGEASRTVDARLIKTSSCIHRIAHLQVSETMADFSDFARRGNDIANGQKQPI